MHNKRRQNNMGGGNGGGPHRHHNNNRPRRFNNNRPQGGEGGTDPASVARTRRNATQSKEKYQMMAQTALSTGDRVLAEYYLQHADHYHRVLLALPPEEVRQHHQHRPQNGEQQPGGEQAADGNSNGNGNGAPHADGQHQHSMTDGASDNGHALPSFITQPTHSANPEE